MVKNYENVRHNDLIDDLPPINKNVKRKRSIAQSNHVPDEDLNLLDAFNSLKAPAKKVKKRISKNMILPPKRNQTLESKTMNDEEFQKDLFLSSEITTKEDPLITVVNSVPDSYRNIFDFKSFNKMQSEAFPLLYQSDDNVVVGAPTGSGKTVLFEMAIIKCLTANSASLKSLKIIYMAPTKALCHEKFVDWQNKFTKIKVGLLTSDTTDYEEHNFYDLQLILCTPEKLDFLTRNWNNYKKTFMSIKLCLVDEIHTINQDRGAVLEAVITRMKKLNTKTRVVAVSATVPNIGDIKEWLTTKSRKAKLLTFDSSYRPIQLKKVVEGLPIDTKNSFQQEKVFMNKVPDVIKKYSNGNSTLVFCATRNSTQQTAQLIAQGVNTKCDSNNIDYIEDESLKRLCYKGVAYHHAGISLNDRKIIENLFRDNKILVLCSTSTLAVGVNINCYLVIIKGTTHWSAEGEKEYEELDIQQMIGRAGRPGAYDKGVAVILTTKNKENTYKSMTTCDIPIESTIHFQFLEHICSEIEIGSIEDAETCSEWILSTYYYIRSKKNPNYYNLDDNILINSGNVDEMSEKVLSMLLSSELIEIDPKTGKYICTEYGKTMCKNYLTYKSMNILKETAKNYSLQTLLEIISKSIAVNKIKHIKNTEKIFLRTLNSLPKIKFSILDKKVSNKKVPINEYWQKVYLLIQFQMEDINIFEQENFMQIKSTILQELADIWKNATRVISALCDIMLFKKDGDGLFECLFLKRSFNSKAWDDGLKTILQVESLGTQSIKNLKNKGVKSLAELQALPPNKLEYYLGLKPGNGYKLKDKILKLPQINIAAECADVVVSATGRCLAQIEITINSLTKQVETFKNSYNQSIDIMIRNSKGELCDYRKMTFSKIGKSKTFMVPVKLKNQVEYFNVSASVSKIAGSSKSSNIKVECPQDLKHVLPSVTLDLTFEEFDSANSTSNKFEEAAKGKDIVNLLNKTIKRVKTENSIKPQYEEENSSSSFETSRNKMNNGNYTCHHTCKNKNECRHMCCHQGIPKNLIKRSGTSNTHKKESLPTVSTPKRGANTFEFSDFDEPSDLDIDAPAPVAKVHQSHNTDFNTSWGDTELEKYVMNQVPKKSKPLNFFKVDSVENVNLKNKTIEHLLSSSESPKRISVQRKKSFTEFLSSDSSDIEASTSKIVTKIKEYSFQNYEESSMINNNASVTIYQPKSIAKTKSPQQLEELSDLHMSEFDIRPVSTQSYDERLKDEMPNNNIVLPKDISKKVNPQMSKLKEISFHESDFSFEIPKVSKANKIEGLEFLGSDIELFDD